MLNVHFVLCIILEFSSQQPNSAVWKVYKLNYADPTSATISDTYSRAFKKKLHFYLGNVFDYVR